MKTKITGRDLKFFFLGILSFFLLDVALNWEESIESFKKGYNDGYRDGKKIEILK